MIGYKLIFGVVTIATTGAVLVAEGGLDVSELKQAPMLVAVVLIVYAFLKHLSGQQKAQAAERERHAQTMKEMGVACHSVQSDHVLQIRAMITESHAIGNAMIKSNDENTRATNQAIRIMERMEKKLE